MASTKRIGKSPSQLKTVDDLCVKLDALRQHRAPLERQWRLNLAFYKGKQYSYYAPKSDRLESLAVDEGSKPRHRVRIVSNQIMPGAHTLLAQLTKTKPSLYATPGSGAESEVRAAQMAQSLFDYWWDDLALDEKLDEALLWSIVASAGYWKITWDPYAAKQMKFLLDPTGKPIVDDALKTRFLSELEKVGVKPQEQIVYMGDVDVNVMSPFDIFIDPTVKTFDEAKYVICRHAMDPDEIKAKWKVDVEPDAAPSSPDSSLPFANSQTSPELSLRNVFIGYFKPTASLPNGRYVVFTEGSDKKILSDEKWPYPHNELPVVKFAGMRVPGSVYDDATVTHAIPLQKELNRTVSQIVEYKNLTINPVMTAPAGSLRTRRTTEPGQVLEYQIVGNGNLKPEFEQLPTLPPYVFEHLKDINSRLQDVFLSAEVLQGKVPPNVEAGIAIDLLQEMATDKLAPIVKLLEHSLAKAGTQLLSLAQEYYVEPRLLKIKGSGGSVQVKQFVNADIAGNITIKAETGSGLPRTRAGRQARIERLIELGVIPPDQAHKYLDLADLSGLQAQMAADESLAYRNIDKLLQGVPINPEAIQQAMMAVNQGMNPITGQPLSGNPQEVQALLEDAAVTPMPGLDYSQHANITALFMKGIEFDGLDPQTRQAFLTYYGKLEEAARQRPMPEPQAPRVNLQIKSTAGATTQAKILQEAGIPIDEQDTLEPPLETWVSDSVDQPDTDAAGPGQEAEHLSKAAQVVMATKLADAEAKHNAAMKQQEHDTSQATSHAQASRDAELHQQSVRKAKAEADLAEKKARQSDFKPKPAAPKKGK